MFANKERHVIGITGEVSRHFAVMSFVSAVFVVALHSLSADRSGVLVRCIHSFIVGGLLQTAIPWFFFASGFFLAGHIDEVDWYKNAINKRIRSLLVPFWVWSFVICSISILFAVAVRMVGYDFRGVDGFSLLSLNGLLRVCGLDYYDTMPTMWYLRTLFVFVLVAPVLSRINTLGLVLLFALSCVFDIIPDKGRIVTQIGHNLFSVRGLFYFSLGLYVRQNYGLFRQKLYKGCSLIAFAGIALCVVRVLAEYYGYRRMATFLCAFQLPFLTCFMWCVCGRFQISNRWTSLSFPLYVTHMVVILIITAIYAALGIGGSGNITVVKGVARFVLGLSIALCLCLSLRKVFPGASKIIFGGR